MAQSSHHRHCSLEDIVNEHLYLCHYGFEQCRGGHAYGPAIRDFYLIHYVSAGRGTFTVQNTVYPIHSHQSFIIYPGETTTYRADDREPWTYYYFSLSGKLAPTLIQMTDFAGGRRVIDMHNDDLMTIIRESVDKIDTQRNKYCYGISALTAMINTYAQRSEHIDPAVSKVVSYASQAKDYIDFNYSDDLTVEKIAAVLSISRNHLYRLFKAEFGLSPMEYLTQRRIRFATRLLTETDQPAAEIASLAGFDTYSAFYRAFKLASGMSANQYRAAHPGHSSGDRAHTDK
ncbi:MAG: helix-turn-helix domain-containing protein [Acutalibacteraceae bacterium]|nr:AraC family transcriptional regulator [Clostridiales bacterium]